MFSLNRIQLQLACEKRNPTMVNQQWLALNGDHPTMNTTAVVILSTNSDGIPVDTNPALWQIRMAIKIHGKTKPLTHVHHIYIYVCEPLAACVLVTISSALTVPLQENRHGTGGALEDGRIGVPGSPHRLPGGKKVFSFGPS